MSELLTAADLFRDRDSAEWPKPERIEIPELGRHVFVRVLNVGERLAMENAGDERPMLLVALCACDEQGKTILSEAAAKELATSDGRVVYRIAQAALRVNGLGGQQREEAEKNSSPARNGSSSSGSPATSEKLSVS